MLNITDIETVRKINEYSNEILEVIDNKEEFTQSDFQGVIDAIVIKIMRETEAAKK